MPYYIEGEPETDFLKITNARGNPPARSRRRHGHMLTTPSTCSSHLRRSGLRPAKIPALICGNNSTGLRSCPRAASSRAGACVKGGIVGRFFPKRAAVRPQNHRAAERAVWYKGRANDYIEAPWSRRTVRSKPVQVAPELEERNFGSLIQPAWIERTWPLCAMHQAKGPRGQLSCAETPPSKSCGVLAQASAHPAVSVVRGLIRVLGSKG